MLKEYYDIKLEEWEKEKSKIKNAMIPYKSFSWFEKIFKRKQVKEYREKYLDSIGLESKIRDIENRINLFKDNIAHYKKSGQISRESVEEMQKLIQEGKIPYVLNKDDSSISNIYHNSLEKEENPFHTLDDFILVHKTDFLPTNDTIYTPKSTQAQRTVSFEFRGNNYSTNVCVANNSTHFAVNGAVSSHLYGNWDNCKYAVLVSLANVDRSNLIGVRPEDTYFDGNVSLGKNYYILMPQNEINKGMPELNPNATIVSYSGLSLDEAVSSFITYCGKKRESISSNAWCSNDFEKFAEPFLEKNDIPFARPHVNSENFIKARTESNANGIIAIFECLKQHNLEATDEELYNIIKKHTFLDCLDEYNSFCKKSQEIDNYDKYYLSIFRQHGYDVPREILEEDDEIKKTFGDRKEYTCDIVNKYIVQALQKGKILPECKAFEREGND